ncbi:hypothetical protein C8J57DRAFT_1508008 [Mycena rebaudengoi]|nr:hypothetical protein C8J57DRAFT_1508008 [Mycena rebaudengoi]
MPPPAIALAGIMVDTYGIYLVLFITSIYLLLGRHNSGNTARFSASSWSIMFYSSCALFVVVTGHWIVNVCRAFIGFIYFQDGAGAVAFFKDNTQPTITAFNRFVGLAFVVGDGMIIYRLWIVWGLNKLVVLLPTIVILQVFYTFLIVLRSRLGGKDISATKLVTPTSALTLGIIVVESAALYTTLMVVYEITYQLNSQVQYAEAHFIPPIIGIANALIQFPHPFRAQGQGGEATTDSTQVMELKSVSI